MTALQPAGWQPEAFVQHVEDVLGELNRRHDRRLSLRAFVDLPKDWTSADSGITPRAAWASPQGRRAEALGVAKHCPVTQVRWQQDLPHPEDLAELRAWLAQHPLLTEALVVCGFPQRQDGDVVVPIHLWLPRLWLEEQADGRVQATLVLLGEDEPANVRAELRDLLARLLPPTHSNTPIHADIHADSAHITAIAQLVTAMQAGEAHKVVWSRTLPISAGLSRGLLAHRMAQSRPEAWLVDVELTSGENFLCATPELLVRCQGEQLTTMALAGTGSVAQLSADDPRLGDEHGQVRDFVHARLTQLGVTDLELRADLTRAGPLTHRRTQMTGKRPATLDALTAALTLHPTPALLGVPRAQALDLLAQRESARGLYSGCVGRLACDGSGEGEVVALLRGVSSEGGQWQARAGAGLVPQSEPADEAAEIANKLSAIVQSLNPVLP